MVCCIMVRSVAKQYKLFLDLQVDDEQRVNKFDEILTKCVTRFSGWLLYHVASVVTKGRSQLFYVSFMNHYFGISRDGIAANARYGFGVTNDMFDDLRRAHEFKAADIVLQILLLPHSFWYDNFSKFLTHSIPSVKKDIFASCLWTGVTINQYSGPPVPISVVYDDDGTSIPAMPTDLMECKANVQQNIVDCYNEGRSYFDDSLVNQYNINSIPLTIDVKKFPDMKAIITSPKNSTEFIHPQKLIKRNIGTNRGWVISYPKRHGR